MRHQLTISTGTVTVSGDVTVGTPGNASATISITGAGTLKLGGAFWSAGTGGGTLNTAAGSTVEYNGTAAQTVKARAYSNLVLSGSGVKTLPQGTSTTAKLSIAPTGNATASIVPGSPVTPLIVNNLSLGGLGRIGGTWGSTTSAAAHTNDSFFAATTGMLNVGNDTRTTPTVTTWPTASKITYGQTLSASTLTGGVSPAGSFAFTNPTTKPDAGTYNASVTFTATDTTAFNPQTTTGNVDVQVDPADTVTTVTGGTFDYNGAAHPATVKVTAFNGTVDLTPASPVVAYTGSCSAAPVTVAEGANCTASYSYAGDSNYKPSNGSAAIIINPVNATVTTWPTAGGITYGDALSASSLTDGVASPEGSFAFADG